MGWGEEENYFRWYQQTLPRSLFLLWDYLMHHPANWSRKDLRKNMERRGWRAAGSSGVLPVIWWLIWGNSLSFLWDLAPLSFVLFIHLIAFRTLFLFSNGELLFFFNFLTKQKYENSITILMYSCREIRPNLWASLICFLPILLVDSTWSAFSLLSSVAFCHQFMHPVQVLCRPRAEK